MLSDSPHKKKIRTRPARAIDAEKKQWSDNQKLQCVTTYLMLGGNTPLTSMTTKIPEGTIHKWKRTEWWNELVNEIRKEERLTLSTKLKKIVENSWDIVEDRLAKGDYVYDQRKGELIRKPMNGKDVAKIANDTSLLRNKLEIAENYTVAQDQIEDKLNKLAQAFTDLAKGKLTTGPIEDAVIIEEEADAVYEEDPTPVGTNESHQSTGLLETSGWKIDKADGSNS